MLFLCYHSTSHPITNPPIEADLADEDIKVVVSDHVVSKVKESSLIFKIIRMFIVILLFLGVSYVTYINPYHGVVVVLVMIAFASIRRLIQILFFPSKNYIKME